MSTKEKGNENQNCELIELAKNCQADRDLLQTLVERCRDLTPLVYAQMRKPIAMAAGLTPVTALDAAVQVQRRDPVPLPGLITVEPCAQPVEPAELLTDISNFFARFIFAPRHVLDAAALHIVFCHALDAFSIAPRLFITSPERECGKSLLMELMAALGQRSLIAAAVTDAVLPRVIERYRATVFLDEIDTYRLNEREGLAGILNSGHRRRTAFAFKTSGEHHEPKAFSTWAGYVFAGIFGKMPDTTRSRCIVLRLGRKPTSVRLERFGQRQEKEAEALARRIARYAVDHAVPLEALDQGDDQDSPVLGSDRGLDNWRPLLAVATTAGKDWVRRAVAAARELSGRTSEPEASGAILVADLHALFFRIEGIASPLQDAAVVPSAMFSQDIVERLTKEKCFAERPWAEYKQGRPLTVHGLAALLTPYGVHSGNVWVHGVQGKGYKLDHLRPVFEQYLKDAVGERDAKTVRREESIESPQDGIGTQDASEPSGRPVEQDRSTPADRPVRRRRTAAARNSASADDTASLFGETQARAANRL